MHVHMSAHIATHMHVGLDIFDWQMGLFFCHFQGVSIQKFHKGVTQVCTSQAQNITSKTVCVVTSPIMFLSVHLDCHGRRLVLLPIHTFR